ncbi:hypothetical protein OKZ62_001879 [Vibrio navarrensis]|nr:hypothetical protein [Vibrio navarrensis]
MFDPFNKKKVAELERQLKLANDKIHSLNSDVRELERQKYVLEVELGKRPKKNASAVKMAESAFYQKHREDLVKRTQSSTETFRNHSPTSDDGLMTGVLLGSMLSNISSDEQRACHTENSPNDDACESSSSDNNYRNGGDSSSDYSSSDYSSSDTSSSFD